LLRVLLNVLDTGFRKAIDESGSIGRQVHHENENKELPLAGSDHKSVVFRHARLSALRFVLQVLVFFLIPNLKA